MISFRYLFALFPLLALAACDKEPAPPIDPASPPKPQVAAPAAVPAAPVPAPVAKPQAEQASEPAQPSAAVKALASEPAQKKTPAANAVAPPVPELELDLSLPPEVLEAPDSFDSFSQLPTLLPPLFGGEAARSNPFQLQGKLLTNERGDQDYWESLEGAELQFEFKR